MSGPTTGLGAFGADQGSDHDPTSTAGRTGHGPRIWSFASGSGGVGRSTLTTVLGSRLVARGGTACLVDGDWSSPLLTLLLDVPAHSQGDIWSSERLHPVCRSQEAGLDVLASGGPMVRSPMEAVAPTILQRLRSLPHDDVVVDLPGGSHGAALDLWLASDLPMLVAVPERLPLEATARLLSSVFARLARPWLTERFGLQDAQLILAEAWQQCAGRTGTWMRSVAKRAEVPADDLAEFVGRKPIHLLLNRVRRADDIDVGHALVTAAGHGLGLDLRFRAVLPFEDEGWIRARRLSVKLSGVTTSLLNMEVDDFLDRVETDSEVPAPQAWGCGAESNQGESMVGP